MQKEQSHYQQLVQFSKRARIFESIESLLHWDQETYMPQKGIIIRAEQLELIASLHHEAKTDKNFGKLLGELIDLKSGEIYATTLTFEEKASLKRWRRDFLLNTALPNDFVCEFAKLNSQAISIWGEAREQNNFALFAPYLQKTIEMSRQKAAYINPKGAIYDVLIDFHEPEMTTKELEEYFTSLKKVLLPLLEKIKSAKATEDHFLHGTFAKEKQIEFGNLLLKELGYDLHSGRLDLSRHPFSTSFHPNDSRITTRIHKSGLFDSLSAVLHEAGHSIYEMGLNPQAYGTPLCQALSLGIHESQSRFYETYIGQSKAFWHTLFPKLQDTFKPQLDGVTLEQFYKAINKVSPSLIRVEADEITYTFHIIIRFEIEKALLEGTLALEDLPAVWNEKMRTYLGVEVPNEKEGCLQDIHWSMGEFGYFPTYSLGNLYGAQFFEAFTKEYSDWQERFERGEFLFVKEWLGREIHSHGRIYSAKELVERVSGKPLGTKAYLEYLTKKYSIVD